MNLLMYHYVIFKVSLCMQVGKKLCFIFLGCSAKAFTGCAAVLSVPTAAAADAARCLVTVSMVPAPIVMVIGQGRETQ